MWNDKLRQVLRQRRTALYAVMVGIAVAATSTLTALPSGASAKAGSAIPASAIPKLTTTMLWMAQRNGDAHPASIEAVFTTQDQALRAATPGDTIPGSDGRLVYLVVMTGHFKLNVPVPPGAHLPTGRYFAVTLNPATLRVMDLGLSNHAPPVSLRSLGRVSSLARQR